MKTLSRFVIKFTSLIVAVLSCFDRIIFKGYLPITNATSLEGFVDCVLKIRRCDFMAFAEEQSEGPARTRIAMATRSQGGRKISENIRCYAANLPFSAIVAIERPLAIGVDSKSSESVARAGAVS